MTVPSDPEIPPITSLASTPGSVSPTSTDTRFFGHPRALAHLFGVEMWERFSFYGMLGILAIYIYYSTRDGGLGLSESAATSVVGAYGGTVYLSTIVGAWIADRLLGSERTLFYSAILIMFGHVSLAVLPGAAGLGVGLTLVALGSGGLKGNTTAVVGTLYSERDQRRDSGFTIFYIGVNLGAFVGQLLTGWVQREVGFHYGFGLAAVGMALGLIQYSFGRKELSDAARRVPDPLPANRRLVAALVGIVVALAVVVVALTGVVTVENLSDTVIWVSSTAAGILILIMVTSKKVTTIERRRVFSFIPLFVSSFAFWALYQQIFTVVTIYADKRLDRRLFGWETPVSWATSIDPVFIVLLGGVFAAMWVKLGNRQPTTPVKFALGTILVGLGFWLFLPTAGGGPHSTPFIALAGILLVFTLGELMLSPVGLSVSTKLAPKAFGAQMVALNFLSVALGTALSGSLAKYYTADHEFAYFGVVGGVCVAIGLLVAATSPITRKLMSGVR
ncbi:MAG: peptide MFS transporter [Mycobacteriales bacterium]